MTGTLRETLRRLVSIESVNPSLDPGGGGEVEIARYVRDRLEAMGLDVTVLEGTPGRPSVVGRLPGGGDGRSLTLNAHLDTVGVEGMETPFDPEVDGDLLFGRGAYDMKGALAACMAAIERLSESGEELAGDVLLAAVADEEHASLGTREVLGEFRTDGAVVTEPTGLDVCVAHKGFGWAEISVTGRAAHGSRPDLGVDANLAMGRVLEELRDLVTELGDREPHPRLGSPSLHVGRLSGGTAPSVYAARSRATVERRLLPGEGREEVEREMEDLLDRVREAAGPEGREPGAEGDVELRVDLVRPPFEVDGDGDLVRSLRRSAAGVLGRTPPLVGEDPWTDAALYAEAGVETAVMGPAGGGAHADREWVEIPSVEALASILVGVARDYCSDGEES